MFSFTFFLIPSPKKSPEKKFSLRFYVKVFGDTFETDFDPVADYYRSSGIETGGIRVGLGIETGGICVFFVG